MKNTKKILALALLTSLSVNALPLTNSTSISYASQNLDFGINTKNFENNSVTLTLNQDENNKEASLAALKAVRAEMWDKNVPYTYEQDSNKNNTKLRDFLKTKGINSKEEYLNHTKWSTDLEKIAIQRIYEVSLTGLSHNRPDGSSCNTAVLPSKVKMYAEILANNSDAYTPAKAFSQWTHGKRSNYNGKSEYELLLEANGVYNIGNAHLHIILDPEYDHMGLAINNSSELNYVGVEFGYADKSGNKATGLVGDYTMNFGKNIVDTNQNEGNKENIKSKKELLREAVEYNKSQVASAKFLLKNLPKTVAKVKDKLEAQIKTAEAIIEKSEKYLNK